MGLVVVLVEEMDVVGGHRLEAELRGQLEQARGDLALRFQTVVVDFDVNVLLAEDVDQLGHRLARLAFVAEQQPLVDRAGNAAAEADDALRELAQRGAVDPRLAVVEALQVAERDELLQVAPALVGLGQQRHVAGPLAAGDVLLVLQAAGGEVDLAAEDRLHPRLLAGLVELDRAEQVAVVGHRHRRHPELLRLGRDLLGPGHPVEERVFGVQVEVDEGVGHRAGGTLDAEAGEGKQEGWAGEAPSTKRGAGGSPAALLGERPVIPHDDRPLLPTKSAGEPPAPLLGDA